MPRHRRRRRSSGRLGSWPSVFTSWMENHVAPSTAPSTKKAIKEKPAKKSKIEKAMERGSKCCPVVRVKCETRVVKVQGKKRTRTLVPGSDQYGSGTYTLTPTMVDRRVKFCAVEAGDHKGDMMLPKEAAVELGAVKRILRDNNCQVHVVGAGSLGARATGGSGKSKGRRGKRK